MSLLTTIKSRILTEDVLQIVRFGISGLSSTLVYFVCINLLVLGLKTEPVPASVISYAISVVFSYLMQSRFTFRSDKDSARQVLKFVVTSLFGFAVSYFSVAYFTEYLGLHYIVGAIIVCAVLPIANYFIFKRWVFARLDD